MIPSTQWGKGSLTFTENCRKIGSLDTARNYCLSAETTLNFNTDDRNGKEMEERKNRRKNLQYREINLRTKDERTRHHFSVINLGKENHIGFGGLIGLSKFRVYINILVECPNGDCLWAEGESDIKNEKISGLEMYTHIYI